MKVRAWRMTKARHAATAFNGAGAETFGGRWNSPGTPVVYVAGSASLALLEILVHLRPNDPLDRYVLFEVTFDASLVITIEPATLPRTWRRHPPSPATQTVGDTWARERRSAVLRLPSVIVTGESNYLLNPRHEDFTKINIGPKTQARIDSRLLRPPLR